METRRVKLALYVELATRLVIAPYQILALHDDLALYLALVPCQILAPHVKLSPCFVEASQNLILKNHVDLVLNAFVKLCQYWWHAPHGVWLDGHVGVGRALHVVATPVVFTPQEKLAPVAPAGAPALLYGT